MFQVVLNQIFSFEVGFIAFIVSLFVFQLISTKNWVSEKINLLTYKTLVGLGFICSIYLILAGLNLLASGYLEEFTKPALEKIVSDPEILKPVHSPKKALAVGLILILPWGLVIIGGLFAFLYRLTWKQFSQDNK
tara:strand:+ start:667 stop:1071 length:405 start_codon:yes stop_codon:yes gene_type:complete